MHKVDRCARGCSSRRALPSLPSENNYLYKTTSWSFFKRAVRSLHWFVVVRAVLPSVCARFIVSSGYFLDLGASCRAAHTELFTTQTSLRFARSRAPSAQAPPRPHFVHYSASLICLKGGWGCRPCFGRCSAVAQSGLCRLCVVRRCHSA